MYCMARNINFRLVSGYSTCTHLITIHVLLGIDRLMREVTEGKRGIHWTFTTTLEGEDFADDITIQSHTQQIMQIWHVKLTKKSQT